MLHEIPENLSLSLAATLVQLSPAAFRVAFIDEGGPVDYGPDGLAGKFYVGRVSLERAIGRKITLDEYRAADQALNANRQYQYHYRRRSMSEHEQVKLYRQEKR
jgi:hypothetical protein